MRYQGHPLLVAGGNARICGEIDCNAQSCKLKLINKSGRYSRYEDRSEVHLREVARVIGQCVAPLGLEVETEFMSGKEPEPLILPNVDPARASGGIHTEKKQTRTEAPTADGMADKCGHLGSRPTPRSVWRTSSPQCAELGDYLHDVARSASYETASVGGSLGDQMLQLVAYLSPIVRIRERRFAADDWRPLLRERRIQLDEGPLIIADVVRRYDRIDRTLRNADSAIDALVRIDDEKIRPLAKAIGWAYFNAIGITAPDAAFCHDISH